MTVRLNKLNKFTICPKCGCTDYAVDYMADGRKSCKKCKHKMETIMLKTIMPGLDIPDNCSFCGKEGEKDDEVPTGKDGIYVFKCKGCGELDGFLVLDDYDDEAGFYFDDSEPDNRQYRRMDVKIAEKEGKLVLSASKDKEIVKAIKKQERSPPPEEKSQKQFNELIREKYQIMLQSGIDPEIIRRASMEVRTFISSKGMFTKKQLESLLSAAITLAQDDLTRMGNFNRTKITERQMENIFSVDRKTSRKWKKTLRENGKPVRLFVYAHLGIEESADRRAELPKDLQAVRKIENPKKGKCDFCEQNKLLVWKLEYSFGLWNKICQDSYERLKSYSLEEEWKIENL